MRGQLLLVGNDFVYGGGVQLYAACYDCVVAENKFRHFGFSNCECHDAESSYIIVGILMLQPV